MTQLVDKKHDDHHIAEDVGHQQNLEVHARLVSLLRELITEKYHGKMDAETIETNAQDLSRRMTAHIANLGLDQYRRVRPAAKRDN